MRGSQFLWISVASVIFLLPQFDTKDALEGMTLPENFLALDVVPQLELLPKCHAFITHGGANSVHEALSFGFLANIGY